MSAAKDRAMKRTVFSILLCSVFLNAPVWAQTIPEMEQTRARLMLVTVAADTGFGPGQPDLLYVRETVRRLGYPWGLNGKRGDPNTPSHDIIAYDWKPGAQPVLVDVLFDGGGENKLQWLILEYPQTAGAVFIRVADGAAPTPSPLPSPPPAACDLTPFLADITALRTAIDRLSERQAAVTALIEALQIQLAAHDAQPSPLYRISIFGKSVIARPQP